MTGAVFKEEHQGQGNSKGADKEVQSNGITIGIFFNERQDQGTGDAGSAPSRKDAAVDGTEVFRTEEVAEIGRHTREAAAIAGNDEKDQDLETEGTRNAGQLPEGQNFNDKEEDISSRAAKVVGYSRPSNTASAVHETDEADHRSGRHRRHADDILCHRRCDGQKGDTTSNIGKEEPPNSIELPSLHSLADSELRLGVGVFDRCFFFSLGWNVPYCRRSQVERRRRHDNQIDATEDDEVSH